ncbi:MAG TPA: hypothetical protein VFT22_37910 [Kofleriaceae bacterium]|nr:hypothetical protein [Kofleriaceae bacterium]
MVDDADVDRRGSPREPPAPARSAPRAATEPGALGDAAVSDAAVPDAASIDAGRDAVADASIADAAVIHVPDPVPRSVSGNGRREAGELCDDGNRRDGDGCSSTCRIERPVPNVKLIRISGAPPRLGDATVQHAQLQRLCEAMATSGCTSPRLERSERGGHALTGARR